MFSWILKRLHVHYWIDSAWNRYLIATEQTCRCSAKRWHTLEDYKRGFFEAPEWRDGEHPIAADMRSKGIERNY